MGDDLEQAKRRLRLRMTTARQRLTAAAAAELSRSVCARLLKDAVFGAATHIVAYSAVGNEVDPSKVVDAARLAGRPVYYPRRRGASLEFLGADEATLQPGPGGLLEPTQGDPLSESAPDVLFLVPGVAFDTRGVRLGRGAGCYDRALARFTSARFLGLAYDFQVVPFLPEASWDVRMHALVTDARLMECADRSIGQ
jgi:5-formyltetrahydrofolate cyclo-ligase